MIDDWRLTDQMDYLYKAPLIKAKFRRAGSNDHEHCEFCWEKFGEENGVLHIGYCTCDRYRWICEQCYNDFKELFDWKLVDEKTITKQIVAKHDLYLEKLTSTILNDMVNTAYVHASDKSSGHRVQDVTISYGSAENFV